MARDGEIQNRGLLHALSDFLDIGGVKRAPPLLDVGDVKTVIDLGGLQAQASPDEEGTFRIDQIGNYGLAGESDFRVYAISESGGTGIWESNVGRRVDAMHFRLELDAAGTAAMNGKGVVMEWGYNEDGGDPGGSVAIGQIKTLIGSSAAGGRLVYDVPIFAAFNSNPAGTPFQLASTWDGRIPGRVSFYLRVFTSDDTNFPANTEWNVFFGWRWSGNLYPPRQ